MSDKPATPLLDQVTRPADLKRLSDAELTQVARELRAETISAVSETGGHLGAGLGVVAGLIVAALVCGLIANLSLIEQHLALIADDIEEMRARDAGELDEGDGK